MSCGARACAREGGSERIISNSRHLPPRKRVALCGCFTQSTCTCREVTGPCPCPALYSLLFAPAESERAHTATHRPRVTPPSVTACCFYSLLFTLYTQTAQRSELRRETSEATQPRTNPRPPTCNKTKKHSHSALALGTRVLSRDDRESPVEAERVRRVKRVPVEIASHVSHKRSRSATVTVTQDLRACRMYLHIFSNIHYCTTPTVHALGCLL